MNPEASSITMTAWSSTKVGGFVVVVKMEAEIGYTDVWPLISARNVQLISFEAESGSRLRLRHIFKAVSRNGTISALEPPLQYGSLPRVSKQATANVLALP